MWPEIGGVRSDAPRQPARAQSTRERQGASPTGDNCARHFLRGSHKNAKNLRAPAGLALHGARPERGSGTLASVLFALGLILATGGPLGLRTQGPLRELFLDMTAADARPIDRPDFEVRYSIANTWNEPMTVQRGPAQATQWLDEQADSLSLRGRRGRGWRRPGRRWSGGSLSTGVAGATGPSRAGTPWSAPSTTSARPSRETRCSFSTRTAAGAPSTSPRPPWLRAI